MANDILRYEFSVTIFTHDISKLYASRSVIRVGVVIVSKRKKKGNREKEKRKSET